MKHTLLLLVMSTITLAATPLWANPMRKAHAMPNATSSPMGLDGKCYADDADGLNAQNKSATIKWVIKLNERQQRSPLRVQKHQKKQLAQQLMAIAKAQKPQVTQHTQSDVREVFNGPIVKITAAGVATVSIALILKFLLGKPSCTPPATEPETKQQWTRLKPLKKYKTIDAYKPGEVLTCVGCGQDPIEGAGYTGGGELGDQYGGATSTDTSSPGATSAFRGRSMTGTATPSSRYSSRSGSTPQLATPNTRVGLGRVGVGKR